MVHSGTLSSLQFANMEEPKPKRLKTDEVKTVLFLIHHHSWKATVMLPTRHAFPLQEVEKALKKENLPVAIFPKGKFEVVRKNLDFQIAIFKHHRNGVVGCRKTDSEQHDILPPSIECHKNITEFIRQPNNLRIGFQFLWGIEQPYTVDEGKVLLEVQFSPTCGPELEAQRTSILTGFLRSHYGKKYKITASSSGRNSIRYCQFSGGGDIEISKDPTKSISAVLLVGGGQQEEQQTEHCTELHTPPKAGEVGSGVIESEGVSMQTENDVTKQLVANMVLRAATTLHRFAESQPIQKVEDLRYLVTYGCQMGPVHSLKLLKLHIDFEEERLVFFELFHLPPCVASGAYIDMVLNYIFEALDMT